MAEYNDVIKQFKRMCKSVTPVKCTRGECPMGCENIGQCRKVAFEQPAHFAATVMRWAKEHPEPVYPTWYEYLEKVFDPEVTKYPNDAESFFYAVCTYRIKADIAQKLGIEPKEG